MTLKITFTTLCLALLAAAAYAKDPTIDTRAKAEATFDGLLPVRHSNFARAWVDPDIDLSGYTKIMGGGAQFQFRAARKPAGTEAGRSKRNQTDFPISEKNQIRLAETAGEIFEAELRKSTRFEWTEEKGEDVLTIRGQMLDIASHVPPLQAGRTEIYLTSVGQITLVLEVVDSISGEVLARAAERRELTTSMGNARNNPVTTWSTFRQIAQLWASQLRNGLDNFPDTIQ